MSAVVSRPGCSAGTWWRRITSGTRTGTASRTATASRSINRMLHCLGKVIMCSFLPQEQLWDDTLLLQPDPRARWQGEEDVSEPLLWHPHHHPGHPQRQAHLLRQDLRDWRHPGPVLWSLDDITPRAPLLSVTLPQEDNFQEGRTHRKAQSKYQFK